MIQVNMHSDLMKIIRPDSGYTKEMEFANKLHDMTLEMEDKNQRYFLFVEDEDDVIPHPIGLVVFDPQKLITDQPRPNTIAFAIQTMVRILIINALQLFLWSGVS